MKNGCSFMKEYGFPLQGLGPFLGMTRIMQLSARMFLQSFTFNGRWIPQATTAKFFCDVPCVILWVCFRFLRYGWTTTLPPSMANLPPTVLISFTAASAFAHAANSVIDALPMLL